MGRQKEHKGHREGSITERKDGRFQVMITLETGKRKYYYAKNKSQAREILRKALNDQQQGMLVDASQQSVEQYLHEWLDSHKLTIRPRSYERYEAYVRLHLIPSLGKIKLQKLTAQHLDKLYRQKIEAGLAPKTVASIHNMLHTALEKAVRLGLVARNVCKMVSPPRHVRKEIKPLSIEQVRKLLDAAKGHPLEALFVLAITTGMRRGELFALKWQDIDFDRETLYVRRALVRMPSGGYEEAEPKTSKSRRGIVLTSIAIDAVNRHRARQQEIKAGVGGSWQDHDYVFCTPIGTYLTPGHNGLVQLKKLLQKAGLPDIRFHDLRHSAASLLLSEGVHPKIVQEILGHTEISMTMDIYSHVLPTMQKEAMNKLDSLFDK